MQIKNEGRVLQFVCMFLCRSEEDAAMTEEAWMPVLRVRAPQLLVWRIEVSCSWFQSVRRQ